MPSPLEHVVVVGASLAGLRACEGLRQQGYEGRITLLGDEVEPPYDRPPLSKAFLAGDWDAERIRLRKAEVLSTLHLDMRLGARATSLGTAAARLGLADGSSVAYDGLIIATGAAPRRLPGQPDVEGVLSLRTLADSSALRSLLTAPRDRPARLVVIGAGFIGCIIMEALASRGVELTVVEMGDRMVPRMMGPVAGGMIRQWCEKKGVHVRTGARVEAIVPGDTGQPLKVRLSTGEKIDADLVISATGVRPSIHFLEGSGINCLQGILTDEHLQTSVPGVFAAGDCAEAFDKVSGRTIVSAIQPNAAEQARVAALNMLGQTTALKGVTQINVLDTLGLISTSFGNWQGVPGGEHAELGVERLARAFS